jgi:S1-C subfamily serine protease
VSIRITTLALVATAALRPLAGLAQPPDNATTNRRAIVTALEQTLVETIAGAEPSVVAISRSTQAAAETGQTPFVVEDVLGDLRPAGSADTVLPVVAAGVVIDKSGLVLTQYLAVHEGDAHTITTIDGKSYAATVRAADPRSGLAVLTIGAQNSSRRPADPAPTATPAANFPAVRFGDAAKLRKGQFVVAIGNPFGVVSDGQPTASWGIVTNLARKAPPDSNLNDAPGALNDYRTTLHHLGTLIQTDAKLGWSAGGGALVNLHGELVGLTTTVATIAGHEQPAGYAIPIDATMRRIIDTLKEGREVEYGMLGISFGGAAQLAADHLGGRVVVDRVFAGGPAARAGLQSRDVIHRINGHPITDSDTLQLAVSVLPPSATATVEYVRNGRAATVQVKLTKLAVVGKTVTTVRPESWRGIRVDYATAQDAASFLAAMESNAYDAEGCVLVAEVEPGSPADRAGIRTGMFISHVGGERVRTPDEFRAAVRSIRSERDLRLTQPLEPLGKDKARMPARGITGSNNTD